MMKADEVKVAAKKANMPRYMYDTPEGVAALARFAEASQLYVGGEAAEIVAEAARYRAWRDGDVIVRRGGNGEGWEARHESDPHWDVGSWAYSESLDEAIDTALRYGREGRDISSHQEENP